MGDSFIGGLVYGLVVLADTLIRECLKNLPVTLLVTFLLCFTLVATYHLDKRPPAEPIHIECFSPTGETFTTDIGIKLKKTDYMEYHIVEYNGRETTFQGSCDARKEK